MGQHGEAYSGVAQMYLSCGYKKRTSVSITASPLRFVSENNFLKDDLLIDMTYWKQ